MQTKSNRSIYIVSFFEGAAVMATELCGSKLIAPYFGSSLYVWAAVIAITLGSLAAGYFYGGKLSEKNDRVKKLSLVLFISALYMGAMPFIANLFGPIALRFGLLFSVTISALLLLSVPMLLMGAASPLIISIQTQNSNESGRVSGLVYSISTLGGIISTFLCGFLFIPSFGINATLFVFASLLALSLILLHKSNGFKAAVLLLMFLVSGFTSKTPFKNCIYQSDGMLGKINIIDDTIENSVIRKLLVNNTVQSEMNMQTDKSVSQYIALLDSNLSLTQNKKALVLGMGGGLTSNLLVEKGYKVTGVELDERIVEVAKNYFHLHKSTLAIADDARRFMNNCNEKYDLVLIDVFKAEEQPVHVITTESLNRLKQNLQENAGLIINWHGYLKGERGLGTCILLNTLKSAGFNFKMVAASDKEDERNILIFASLKSPGVKKYEIQEAVESCDLVNTDAKPLLEKYNALANQTWRKNYILYYYSAN